MNGNGSAPFRYVVDTEKGRHVVQLGSPDNDGAKLARWVRERAITGPISVRLEWRLADQKWQRGPTVSIIAEELLR